MANREFNIPMGPDRTGGIDLQPIDFGDLPAASNAKQDQMAPIEPQSAFSQNAAASAMQDVKPMTSNDIVESEPDAQDGYEPEGMSGEEVKNQALDDVQVSFLALKDSIGQSRELKSRERELEALRSKLDEDLEELADRDDILANYQAIVAEQDAIIDENTQMRDDLRAQLADVTARNEEAVEALANMREDHAEHLQPYEIELGRAQATADQAKNDERNRKSELNASETELRRAEDDRASAMAQAKHQQVEAAYEEARMRSDAAKDALARAQQDYDELSDSFYREEAPLERNIEDLEARTVELKDEIAQLSEVIATARKRRQYCDGVYQFPEETEKLRSSVNEDQEAEQSLIAASDELRAQLQQSKEKSKKAKIAIGIVIAVIILIIIAFVVVGGGGAK